MRLKLCLEAWQRRLNPLSLADRDVSGGNVAFENGPGCCNCTPAFVDMRLADALVPILFAISL